MLARAIILFSIAVVFATQAPGLVSWLRHVLGPSSLQGPELAQPAALDPDAIVWLKADPQGHFGGMFRLDGVDVNAIVDTGSTYVALNESLARRIGIAAEQLEFRFPFDTANGRILAAHVWLSHVEIGAIRVDRVEAYVLRDEALKTALIGMSFLSRLRSYAVVSGSLALIR